jgi:hypothetical protein
MSDELQTGEQALAEGRGKIELPEVIEGVETATVAPEIIGATVIEHSEDGTATVTHLPVEEEPVLEDSAIVDRTPIYTGEIFQGSPVVDARHPKLLRVTESKELPKNTLGTQDICPLKDACNHRSADYCKQAKLEADHRRNCIKDHRCDCFHPARGIPQPFRGKL